MLKKFVASQTHFIKFVMTNILRPISRVEKEVDDDFEKHVDTMHKRNKLLLKKSKTLFEISENYSKLAIKSDALKMFESGVEELADRSMNEIIQKFKQIRLDENGSIINKDILREISEIQSKFKEIPNEPMNEFFNQETLEFDNLKYTKETIYQKPSQMFEQAVENNNNKGEISMKDLPSLFTHSTNENLVTENSNVLENGGTVSSQINIGQNTIEEIEQEFLETKENITRNKALDEYSKKIYIDLARSQANLKIITIQEVEMGKEELSKLGSLDLELKGFTKYDQAEQKRKRFWWF